MLGVYIYYVFLFLAISLLLILTILSNKKTNKNKWKISLIILLCTLSYGIIKSIKYSQTHPIHESSSKVFQVASRFSSYIPIYNIGYFLKALQEENLLDSIKNNILTYDLITRETGIDNYIVIVGESARVGNMSVYGYLKPTTPKLQEQLENIVLFNNAISGAPITALAVPLALTKDTVTNHSIHNYPDNIINIANQAGFETSWLSVQSAFGSKGTAVSSIAMNAQNKLWITGYDKGLLLPLYEILNNNKENKKKLIVLHLYGSHEPAENRYPPNAETAIFTEKNDGIDAEYDNSIRYTDDLLGELFEHFKDTKTSILYFSDHALERNPESSTLYYHGGTSPSQEAYHVPMFIWYSPMINVGKNNKIINEFFSTIYNYQLINAWMGIKHKTDISEPDIDNIINTYKDKYEVMDSGYNIYNYNELKHSHAK
ncbi:phosphoethanolamine transferase [Pectobacterium sp. B1J-3]|uniref:phosphoethanolamine transferase n=1 Tax=Pectobacterium sp. B1J-3 TaxID=3385371 RepID=UPI0039068965